MKDIEVEKSKDKKGVLLQTADAIKAVQFSTMIIQVLAPTEIMLANVLTLFRTKNWNKLPHVL